MAGEVDMIYGHPRFSNDCAKSEIDVIQMAAAKIFSGSEFRI